MFKTLFISALLAAQVAHAAALPSWISTKPVPVKRAQRSSRSSRPSVQTRETDQGHGVANHEHADDYEKQAMILSDTLQAKETEIMAAQQQFPQAVTAQQEMAAAYETKAAGLFERMRTTVSASAKRRGDLILECPRALSTAVLPKTSRPS